jgi:hypothetical protein
MQALINVRIHFWSSRITPRDLQATVPFLQNGNKLRSDLEIPFLSVGDMVGAARRVECATVSDLTLTTTLFRLDSQTIQLSFTVQFDGAADEVISIAIAAAVQIRSESGIAHIRNPRRWRHDIRH